jgi:hypothetical protein
MLVGRADKGASLWQRRRASTPAGRDAQMSSGDVQRLLCVLSGRVVTATPRCAGSRAVVRKLQTLFVQPRHTRLGHL